MSLLGLTIGLDKTALTDLVGNASLVNEYAQNVDGNITASLDSATDAFRSAAINGGYSSADIDSLTSSTCPTSVKRWILHGSLDELTSGGMARPDSIATFGSEWRKWLSRLAGGAETIDGLSRATTTGGGMARVGAPSSRVFDSEDESGGLRSRVAKI